MRRTVMIVALVLAGFGALAIRVVVAGGAALDAGDDWLARKKPVEAIAAFETSARWYLPLAPHVDDAYDRLRTLAASEDPALAMMAWRAIRSAARATRTLWQPHGDDLAAADAAIAELAARWPGAAPLSAARERGPEGAVTRGGDPTAMTTTAEREAWHRARLSREVRAGLGGAAVAALGIVLWLAGAVVLVRRGLTAAGTLVRRPALVAGAMIVVGLVLWFGGLYNA